MSRLIAEIIRTFQNRFGKIIDESMVLIVLDVTSPILNKKYFIFRVDGEPEPFIAFEIMSNQNMPNLYHIFAYREFDYVKARLEDEITFMRAVHTDLEYEYKQMNYQPQPIDLG